MNQRNNQSCVNLRVFNTVGLSAESPGLRSGVFYYKRALQNPLPKLKSAKSACFSFPDTVVPPYGAGENLSIVPLLTAFPAFPPATIIIKRMGRAGIKQILPLFSSHIRFCKALYKSIFPHLKPVI